MMHCSVDECRVNDDKSSNNVFLHTLPQDEQLAKKWTQFCRKNIELKPELVRICARHFAKTDYHYNMVKRTKQLRKGAVPSIFPPDIIFGMDEFQEIAMEDFSLTLCNDKHTICPKPVINEGLLKKIRLAVAQLTEVPHCPPLRKLFDDLTFNRSNSHPNHTDLHQMYNVLQPHVRVSLQAFKYSNMDKVLEYYLFNYPVFEKQRDSLRNSNQADKDLTALLDGWYKEYLCFIKVKLEQLPTTVANRSLRDSSTQTQFSDPPATSAFSIEVNGPPEVMDIISISSNKDDVILRFEEERTWDMDDGNLKALLNAPHISFEFKLNEDIWFKRMLSCEYERFILKEYKQKTVLPKNRIRNVRKNDITAESVVYTYGFLSAYLKALSELIRKASDKVSDSRKQELLHAINEFLADVAEINLYNRLVMPTNASVSYVIGECEYVRHKTSETKDINLVEYITPVAKILLLRFAPLPVPTGDLTFRKLEYFRNNMNEFEMLLIGNGLLSFGCTQCKIDFSKSTALFQHCRAKHRYLQPMICERCQQSFDVSVLASERWRHSCPS